MQLRPVFIPSFAILGVSSVAYFTAPGGAGAEEPAAVAVEELFTSEGSSSCPPADALLREINLKQTSAGRLLVGMSEHVTYWNDLGWKDLFSSPVCKGAGEESVHIAFPGGFQLGSGPRHHRILFAQEQHQGAIVAAAATPL